VYCEGYHWWKLTVSTAARCSLRGLHAVIYLALFSTLALPPPRWSVDCNKDPWHCAPIRIKTAPRVRIVFVLHACTVLVCRTLPDICLSMSRVWVLFSLRIPLLSVWSWCAVLNSLWSEICCPYVFSNESSPHTRLRTYSATAYCVRRNVQERCEQRSRNREGSEQRAGGGALASLNLYILSTQRNEYWKRVLVFWAVS